MMDRVMRILRCVLFAFFIVCNAIICSGAVWNLSLMQPLGWRMEVNVYLIVIGAIAVTFSFALMFCELLRPNGFTSLVWVECAWVTLFLVLELAGASAFLAIVPALTCQPLGVPARLNDGRRSRLLTRVSGACSSTRLVLAFTWICSLMLLIYVCFLTISAVIQSKDDPKIWVSSVRHLRWSEERRQLSSAPPSPTRPRFIKKNPSIVAPRPRRVLQAPNIYAYRSGLSDDYQIEHFQPPNAIQSEPVEPEPALLLRNDSQPPVNYNAYPAVSFYPQYMQSAITPAIHQQLPPEQQAGPSSPPPLGDWPRRDVLSHPAKPKRRPAPPLDDELAAIANLTSPSASHTRRPSGPRTRSTMNAYNSRPPPPLDLTNISSHRT
ncbi:hypothetical protein PLEOSDRAFT_1110448 [Pleurotus ostreatus PC15]|uniref:MARVEL domain-containing protein n=1 Tax=Pleurotus ostreatus (strain PC15) TaxID=1137138 RepID=A0A067P9W3_PLEO1|nr:hypothetical protein PLEOSDRAFT_1110448 [Pleurotus ostreatus PC15]